MMKILCLGFFLILSIPSSSEGRDNSETDHQYIYRNSSSGSSQNTTDGANTEANVVFKVYNRKNPNGIFISLDTTESELKSILQQNLSTTLLTHGWLGSVNGSYLAEIREAYMQNYDMNVIAVGWSKISRNEYTMATLGVPEVGATIGRMISNLLTAGLVTLDQVHLVGHSLGAHVMGIAGGFVRDSGYGKVARITGLDPARPGYENVRDESERLDINDGRFVDIIHTSIGFFGYWGTLGHADFYPNGGYNAQPGCTLTANIFCGHLKAVTYFSESIYNEIAFPSVQCDSYFKYKFNQCESNEVVYMGQPTPSSTRGTYYLQTNEIDGREDEMTQFK